MVINILNSINNFGVNGGERNVTGCGIGVVPPVLDWPDFLSSPSPSPYVFDKLQYLKNVSYFFLLLEENYIELSRIIE